MKFETMKATQQHAAAMGLVHSCSWKKAYEGIIPQEIISAFTPESREAIFLEAITLRPEEYYLFKVDGQPAGIASLSKSHESNAPAHIGEIYSIYFHPDFWGTPATQLGLEFCIDRLKQLGFTLITVWVLNDNARAKRFYEKNGFVLDGHTQELEIGVKLLEVRYAKKL